MVQQHGLRRTLRALPVFALLTVALAPVSSRAAVTHDVSIYGSRGQCATAAGTANGTYNENTNTCTPTGNNQAQPPALVIAPWKVYAQPGDVIRITNWSQPKTATYTPALAGAPTTYPTNPNSPDRGHFNPLTSSFTFAGGTQVVNLSGTGCGPTPSAGGTCQPRLVVTATAPEQAPTVPKITSPVAGTTETNWLQFDGEQAIAGDRYRVELRPANQDAPPRHYQYYGDIDGFGDLSGQLKVVNGTYDITVYSIAWEGFEAKTAPIRVTVDADDLELPAFTYSYTTRGIGNSPPRTGPISFSGAGTDDTRLQSVKIKLTYAPSPGFGLITSGWTRDVVLNCTRAWPVTSYDTVPCDSASNPQWIRFSGYAWTASYPGTYSATITVTDGTNAPITRPIFSGLLLY